MGGKSPLALLCHHLGAWILLEQPEHGGAGGEAPGFGIARRIPDKHRENEKYICTLCSGMKYMYIHTYLCYISMAYHLYLYTKTIL